MTTLLTVVAIVLVLLGVVGTLLPGPGAALVLAGLVMLAWLDDFERLGGGTVVVLVALTIGYYVVDLLAAAIGARATGATSGAMAGALAGTLVGFFFGLPGLVIGPFVGAVGAEYLRRGTWRHATTAGLGTWLGLLAGTAVKLAIVLSMIGVAVAAFVRG